MGRSLCNQRWEGERERERERERQTDRQTDGDRQRSYFGYIDCSPLGINTVFGGDVE